MTIPALAWAVLHAAAGLLALLLPLFPWWTNVALASLAALITALLLPGMPGARLARASDPRLAASALYYALGILLVIVCFPTRVDLAAASWGILAGGDGAATLIGRSRAARRRAVRPGTGRQSDPRRRDGRSSVERTRAARVSGALRLNLHGRDSRNGRASRDTSGARDGVSGIASSSSNSRSSSSSGGARWPWNPDKTMAGSLAFVLCGAAMAILLALAVRDAVVPQPSLRFLVIASIAAALGAAAIETLPVRLDDNLSVPAASALVFWCAVQFAAGPTAGGGRLLVEALPDGLLVNGLVALFIWRAGGVSVSGAIAGTALGTLLYAGGGWAGWALFTLAFAAAWGSSRLGLARKSVLGIAEARDGRRGAEHALANCGLATVAAMAALLTPARDAASLALVAALTAAASDTVASEIGKAWGGRTQLITTWRAVAPGTPGAVSLEGTAAGLAAAFLLALVSWLLGLVPLTTLWIIVVAATAGALVESALAATLEARHVLNNHLLNFINTLVAVGVALLLR